MEVALRNIKYLFLLCVFFYNTQAFSHGGGGGEVGLADTEFHIPVHIGFDGHTEWGIGIGEHGDHGGHGHDDHDDHGGHDDHDDHGGHGDHDDHAGSIELSEVLFLAPIVYGGFERFEHVVNLGSNFNPKHDDHGHGHDHGDGHNHIVNNEDEDDIDIFPGDDEELVLERNTDRNNYYKRIKAWNIAVGAGLGLGTHPAGMASWGGGINAHSPQLLVNLFTQKELFKGKLIWKTLRN